MSNDNIILFPSDKITRINENNGNDEERKKIELQQTKEYVETAVDEMALQMLHTFVDLAVKTRDDSFVKDFAFLVDAIRGTIYRDFKVYHPVQELVDKMTTLHYDRNGQQMARMDYSMFLGRKHKKHKPFSDEIKEELNEQSFFEPDFDLDD